MEILANAGVRVQENTDVSIYSVKALWVHESSLPFLHSCRWPDINVNAIDEVWSSEVLGTEGCCILPYSLAELESRTRVQNNCTSKHFAVKAMRCSQPLAREQTLLSCFRWHITNKLFLETTTRFFSSLPHRKPRKGARRGEFDHCTDYVLGSSWEPWRGILILLLQSLQFLVAYGIWETAIKPTYPLPPYSFLEDMCIVCCLLKRLFMWHCRYNQVPILANVLSALEQKVL